MPQVGVQYHAVVVDYQQSSEFCSLMGEEANDHPLGIVACDLPILGAPGCILAVLEEALNADRGTYARSAGLAS